VTGKVVPASAGHAAQARQDDRYSEFDRETRPTSARLLLAPFTISVRIFA